MADDLTRIEQITERYRPDWSPAGDSVTCPYAIVKEGIWARVFSYSLLKTIAISVS